MTGTKRGKHRITKRCFRKGERDRTSESFPHDFLSHARSSLLSPAAVPCPASSPFILPLFFFQILSVPSLGELFSTFRWLRSDKEMKFVLVAKIWLVYYIIVDFFSVAKRRNKKAWNNRMTQNMRQKVFQESKTPSFLFLFFLFFLFFLLSSSYFWLLYSQFYFQLPVLFFFL